MCQNQVSRDRRRATPWGWFRKSEQDGNNHPIVFDSELLTIPIMSGALARSVSDLQYSGLYLPIFTLLYLYYNLELPYSLILFDIHLINIDSAVFQVILIVTILGSIISHGMYRSIHGHKGPLRNPKSPLTVAYQQIALSLSKNPGDRPRSWSELQNKGRGIFETFSAILDHFLDVGMVGKFLIILKYIRNALRAGIILMVRPIYRIVSYISLIPMYSLVIHGQPNYFGAVLFIAHVIYFIGGYIMNWFPTVVPRDSVEWVNVPEYRKSSKLHEQGEIELREDQSNILEGVKDKIYDVANEPQKPDDVDYLISLDNEPEYLVDIEDPEQESE